MGAVKNLGRTGRNMWAILAMDSGRGTEFTATETGHAIMASGSTMTWMEWAYLSGKMEDSMRVSGARATWTVWVDMFGLTSKSTKVSI